MTPEEKQRQLKLRMRMEEEEAQGGPISLEPGSRVPAGMPGIHGATGPAPDDATDAGPSDALKETGPGGEEAYLRGQIQGASSGFGDEVAGGLDAVGSLNNRLRTAVGMSDTRERTPWQQQVDEDLKDLGPTPEAPLGETYVRGRDKDRAANDAARAAHPGKFLSGEVVGAVAVPIPGPGKAATLSRAAKAGINVAKGTGLGALAGAGTSEAEDAAGLAKDTGLGGLVGGGVGAAGEFASWLKGAFANKGAKASADALAKATAAEEKAIASAQGKYRSGVQSASRDLEVMAREAQALPDGHPLKDALKGLLDSPEGMALREQVAGNKMGTAPERIGEMQELLAQYEALAANKGQAISAATEAALSPVTAAKKAGRFLWNYGSRFGGAGAGAALGGELFGPTGAVVGGAIGGAVMGHPGTAIKNLVKDPAVRKATFAALSYGARAPEWLASQTGLPIAIAAEVLHSLKSEDGVPAEPEVTPDMYGGGP